MERFPYHPQVNMQQLHAFDERLRHVPGSWNIIGRSFLHAGDPSVIRLRWLIVGERWCDEAGFLEFLDLRSHRLLLRCFLQHEPETENLQLSLQQPDAANTEHGWQRAWKVKTLLQKMEPEVKRRQLMQALHFLEQQESIVARDRDEWVSSSLLEHIAQFGPTFAWSVQARLQQDHHALTRRCVRFKEWQTLQLHDLDVLAFTQDGLIMTIACVSAGEIPSRFKGVLPNGWASVACFSNGIKVATLSLDTA